MPVIEATLDEIKGEYGDWKYVLAYASDPTPVGMAGQTLERSKVSESGFTASDIAEVIASVNGANDEAAWEAVLRLTDGRFAFVSASCDYTGWG